VRSLFWRIFFSFWIAMILIVAGVAGSVYWIVSDLRSNPPTSFHAEMLAQEAEQIVASGGEKELRSWLEERGRNREQPTVYAFDSSRRELLGRLPPRPDLPPGPMGIAGYEGRPLEPPRRMFTVVGAEGQRYWFIVAPPVSRIGRWLLPIGPARVHWPALVIAIVVTAATCLLLARSLSAPIDKLRKATLAVASGNLGVQVGPSLRGRKDELGLLAADFDHMSDRLRALVHGRQQLMRDLSHELRSPLARLQVALGLARRPGAQVEPQLDRIELEAGRIDALVGQILLLSRLHDPRADVAREPLDIAELLESLVQDSKLEAAGRSIAVELRKDDDYSVQVRGDRQLLSSAIENVLRNAIRYSPDGGQIEVEFHGAYGEIRILVMDRGPGVPAEELGSIFEPFYRAKSQGNRSGHGLGLAITHRIVALHYGTVYARNRNGGGFTVELRLPQK
jgi:two-component system sensor histidine kinase CpxA